MLQHGQLLWRQLARSLHTTYSHWQVNYYESLGIGKSSTQNDIKAAYYKLSMTYHPDRNKGCEDAAKKFREITQAYEVLGNYRLRRLYDKGIVHTAGAQYAQNVPNVEDIPLEEDDAETKFYKSRFQKSKVANPDGTRPIYNFDEWSKAHYGKSFERRQAAQEKFNRLNNQKRNHVLSGENDIVMLTLIFAGFAVYLLFIAESSYDTPKDRARDRYEKQQELKKISASTKTSTENSGDDKV